MRTQKWLPALGGLALIAVLYSTFVSGPGEPADPFGTELARFERWRKHVPEGSAEAFKLQQKADRIRAYQARKPQFDNPGEFARILAEMRIPSDRTTPEYEPGYQQRELQKALLAKPQAATPLPWVNRGPGNVAGRCRAIVVDPDDPTNATWFIGSVGGGVWKTTDSGSTWQWLTPDFPLLSTSTIAMAPSNHDILYVGTGESFYNIDVINGNGILKSVDRGVTWEHLASTVDDPAFNNIARILVDPTDPDVLLVAATRGRYKEYLEQRSSIFKSTDGGATWTEVFFTTDIGDLDRVNKVHHLIADPSDFDILYATVDEAGILKSTDRGDTWTWKNTGITDFRGRFELAISPVETNRLYASAEGASHSELWISSNSGNSWSETTESGGSEPNWLGAQGWYDNTIVCHPTNVNIVYVGGIRLYKITLSGTQRTTQLLDVGSVHVDHHGLVILDDGGGNWRILDTNDGGVGLSGTSDANWDNPIDGLTTTQFYGVDKRPGASAYFGGMQDNGTWYSGFDPDRLAPWTRAIGGDGYETSWHFDDPQKMIGGFQFNGLTRSLDGGQTWEPARNGLGDVGGGEAPFITKIAKSHAAPDLLFAVGAQGVWRSTDFGGSWNLAAIPFSTWGDVSSFVDVKISRADPDVVWAGARMNSDSQIHLSQNGGLSFTALPNYTTEPMGLISGMATHPTDPATAYVLFSFAQRPKILRTTDAGQTWEDITGFEGNTVSANGFPDVAVYDLVVFSDDPNHMWAGTEIGIVESLDGGVSWAIADNGLPHAGIWFMSEVEDEIVVATHGRGIWSVEFPSLIAGKTFKPLLDNLYQSPNGFLTLDLNLRSEYDSTHVIVDNVVVTMLPANTLRQDEIVRVPIIQAGIKDVFLRSFVQSDTIESVTKSIEVYEVGTPTFEYVNDFETANGDFVGSGFRIGGEPGFSGDAIHSQHPYIDGQTAIYTLAVPIRVASAMAHVSFDELALVEPGDAGTVFGDLAFWDYVSVEASIDGLNWIALDGWDAGAYPEWLTAYFQNAPSPSLLRRRTLDLHDAFNPGNLVLLRFKLFADSFVNGWGWIIDNLEIQVGSPTDVAATAPKVSLEQNIPNPFNINTEIRYTLARDGDATLRVYDVRGRIVRTLVTGMQSAGPQSIRWDGRDDNGAVVASGVYVYRLRTEGQLLQRKMTVLK
jgi:photosystem II stability/assembly factor-like uncharacterized protein